MTPRNAQLIVAASLALVVFGSVDLHSGFAQPAQDIPQSLPQGSFLALQQAVDVGLKNHPLVQEGGANLKMNEARTEQARSLYYPQVSANMDAANGAARINPRFVTPAGGLLQPNLSAYSTGILASQRLYDFGYTQNMVQASELSQRASAQDVAARRALIVVNIQRAYLNSLKRRKLVQIAEETVRERGLITSQIETLYRQQLKSKLDFDLARLESVNAQSLLVKSRNDLKSSFADINRAMGVVGAADYVLEDVSVEVRVPRELPSLIADSLAHPELQRAKEQSASAEAKLRAMKRQYLPTISAIASGGQYDTFDSSRNVTTGGWWAGGASVSMPIFTGFMIENQVREASAQQVAAQSISLSIEQALTQQVTNAYLDTLTFAQQITLSEEQVKTAMEALHLSKQRYKLGLGTVVEVTQSEVAVTAAQTRLAEAQYDYKIAEVTLAYAAGRRSQLEIDSTLH